MGEMNLETNPMGVTEETITVPPIDYSAWDFASIEQRIDELEAEVLAIIHRHSVIGLEVDALRKEILDRVKRQSLEPEGTDAEG